MSFQDLFSIYCGEGGRPIEEYWRLTSTKLALLVVDGIRRRDRSIWEVGRVIAQVQAASAGVKNVGPEFPYKLQWDKQGEDDRTEEQKEAELAAALPKLEEIMKQNFK